MNGNATHGMTGTRIHFIWIDMRFRCNNANCNCYRNYGGRGISYDPRWDDFTVFYKEMKDGYDDSKTLDRIDPDGDYCLENCRWATLEEQARNKRKRTNNKTGVTGVHYNKNAHAYRSSVSCIFSGKPKTKTYSINKYGDELAFLIACECRQQSIDLMNLVGAGYTPQHGK